MQNLIQIARNSWLVMLAALGILAGAGMVAYSAISGPPSRDSLQVVDGIVTEASRVTRKSRRTGNTTSYFEMKLKPSAAHRTSGCGCPRSRWRNRMSGR